MQRRRGANALEPRGAGVQIRARDVRLCNFQATYGRADHAGSKQITLGTDAINASDVPAC